MSTDCGVTGESYSYQARCARATSDIIPHIPPHCGHIPNSPLGDKWSNEDFLSYPDPFVPFGEGFFPPPGPRQIPWFALSKFLGDVRWFRAFRCFQGLLEDVQWFVLSRAIRVSWTTPGGLCFQGLLDDVLWFVLSGAFRGSWTTSGGL